MDPITTSALIGAGASVAGGLSSVFGQSSANTRNIALMREQMRWQERMMHFQNEYNTPAMQMQRFKNSGLNPNLIYGHLSPQNSAGVQGVSAPYMENEMSAMPEVAGQFGQNMQNVANIQAQRDLIQSQARLNNANAQDKENELPHNVKRRLFEEKTWKKTLDQMDATLRSTNATIQNVLENTGLVKATTIKTQEEAKNLLQQRMFNRNYMPMQLTALQKDLNIKDWELNNLHLLGNLYTVQIVGQNTQNKILKNELDNWADRYYKEVTLPSQDKHLIDFQQFKLLQGQNGILKLNMPELEYNASKFKIKLIQRQNLYGNNPWWSPNQLLRDLDYIGTYVGLQIENIGQGLKLFGK